MACSLSNWYALSTLPSLFLLQLLTLAKTYLPPVEQGETAEAKKVLLWDFKRVIMAHGSIGDAVADV